MVSASAGSGYHRTNNKLQTPQIPIPIPMKNLTKSALLISLIGFPLSAAVNLGASAQAFTLTGIGPSSSGNGQSKMSWGSCSFDGTNTTCTLSGPFTGFGAGGTYSFALSYPGNGDFPLIAVTSPGSNFFSAQATGQYSLVITLTQPNVAPINFYSFANFSFQYTSPTCTGVPATNCSVSQVGQTAGATITGPIVGTFDPTPHIFAGGALGLPDYGNFASVAPASWIVMYGVNLATTLSQVWNNSFSGNTAPENLYGTSVTVAGVPAYVNYVSPGQANIQVPTGIPTGPQPLVVTTAGGSSTPYTINVNAEEPGMLAPSSFVINSNKYVVALFPDNLTYVLPVSVPGVLTKRAKPGDVVIMYGIGFGPVTPNFNAGQIVTGANTLQASVQIAFAGVQAAIAYQGLTPSIVGLYQFNVTVPSVAASDTVPLTISQNGTPIAQTLVIPIAAQ